MIQQSAYLVIFFSLLLSPFYSPISQRARTLGLTRFRGNITNIHGEGFRLIAGTTTCEDLHLHGPSNTLFTACQGEPYGQFVDWLPPMANFKNKNVEARGTIVVVDPKTFSARSLQLVGFSGMFVTHGIDIIEAEDPGTIHIFAINHLPNPDHYEPRSSAETSPNKVRSQIEVFSHVLGSDTAEYIRSIRHPDIQTPNDLLATSPTSFYVTNDHHYREGFMRDVETVLTSYLAGWSTIMHVEITHLSSSDPTAGYKINTASTGLHDNNGLGRASLYHPDEIIIGDASGGVLTRAWRNLDSSKSQQLNIIEQIPIDSTIDNPFYYHDPYATASNNASGYILAGMPRAYAVSDYLDLTRPIPSMVWHVRRNKVPGKPGTWEKKVIFQDDGLQMRSAATAAMLGIDPKKNGGRKQAWLFVTGWISRAIVATKVDL